MSPLDSKEIKAVNPKGNQHEYSLKGLTLKPPDVKNQFIRKNSDVGKIEGKGIASIRALLCQIGNCYSPLGCCGGWILVMCEHS